MKPQCALVALLAGLAAGGAACVGWMAQPLVRPQPPGALAITVDPARLELSATYAI